MNAPAVNMSMPMAAGGYARGYQAPAEAEAQKEVSTEQIQAMLDDNSKLIVDIIELNNQIKHGKGTAQLGEFTDKLDKKRKLLNKNLMTLAKWADDSAETPRAPPPQQQQHHQHQQQQQHMYASQAQMQAAQYARAGMAMGQMPATVAQMQQAQMQARYSQAQAQAQALAQAQYQARLNSMGAMGPYGQVSMQQQQQRYMDSGMGYGAQTGMQQMHPMRMAGGLSAGYVDPQAAAMRAQQMGFTVGPQGYGMMPPPQAQQRLSPGAQGMQQPAMAMAMGVPTQQQQQQQQQAMMGSMPMSNMPMASMPMASMPMAGTEGPPPTS